MQDQFSLSLGIAAGTGHTHFVGHSGRQRMDVYGWMWLDVDGCVWRVLGWSLDGRWMVVGWLVHPHPSTSIHIHIHPSSKYRPNLENRKSQVDPPGVKSHALNSCLVVPMFNSSQNSSSPELAWEPADIHFYNLAHLFGNSHAESMHA